MKQFKCFSIYVIISTFIVLMAGVVHAATYKQLAAHPEDISTLNITDAKTTGIFSHSVMLPVKRSELQQFSTASSTKQSAGVKSWQAEVWLDAKEASPVIFLSPNANHWTLEGKTPDGQMIKELSSAQRFTMAGQSYSGQSLLVPLSSMGGMQLTLQVPEQSLVNTVAVSDDVVGYVLYKGDPAVQLYSYVDNKQTIQNKRTRLIARLVSSPGNSADRAQWLASRPELGAIGSAQLQVTLPDGGVDLLTLTDDGRFADEIAGDGEFSAWLPTGQLGMYHTELQVSGVRSDGLKFQRSTYDMYPVEAERYQLSKRSATLNILSENRAEIVLSARNDLQKDETVFVAAEVWGQNSMGKPVAVAWAGGLVDALELGGVQRALVLGFDLRWLDRVDVQPPFELRHVRVQSATTNTPISEIALMKLRVPKSVLSERRAVNALNIQQTKTAIGITDEMLMGPQPQLAAKSLVNGLLASGSKLLLVHGYCSDDPWNESQFSSSLEFQDFNANRTHDEFAQRINTFTSGLTSFGIVAHSQGGAAALQLYAKYYSGLDSAGSGRLIQSVGTPYQGTALAGNLAALGNVFGAGCGTNYDLTYNGSSNWLSTIPSWARAKVNYYTTSFDDGWGYDYCHFVSDLFLDDPDDGATERWAGQLSGATNRGHKEGWCHTSSMRDPGQTTDASRNATMSSTAAR